MSFKIYYLDDEPDLCEILYYTLTSDEILVETFQDDLLLIERCELIKPDLVFLDYRLLGTTGEEVAMKLDPQIPKVLITGEINMKTDFSFVEIIKKPFKEEDLTKVINKIKISKKPA
jgi:DNA-binding NtrC family response regulator